MKQSTQSISASALGTGRLVPFPPCLPSVVPLDFLEGGSSLSPSFQSVSSKRAMTSEILHVAGHQQGASSFEASSRGGKEEHSPMRPDVDRPAELVDCVVDDGLAEMAVRLEREARNVARRGCAGAGAHRDWIRRVINVGDARVVASWREREMQPACGDLLAGRFEASAKKDREEI